MRHHGEWNHEQNAKSKKNSSPIFHVTLPGNLQKSTARTQSTSAPAFKAYITATSFMSKTR